MKEIQTTHNKQGVKACDEYYTPIEFIRSLGHFDTDPCVPKDIRWQTADVMYNKEQDGLAQEWKGRVWLNPPYSAPLINQFMKRMAEHGRGIALVLPKFGSKLFREWVYPYAVAIYVLDKRIKFFNSNWEQQRSPIASSILIAYSEADVTSIMESGIEGTLLTL